MNRQWFGVFVVAGFATTAGLGAQGNQSPANTPPADAGAPPAIQRTQQQPPAPAAQPKGNTVTISGCIQDAPMATAAAKPAEPAVGAKTFYLNNATMADAGGKAPVGTSGLTSTGYRLEGEEKLISPHLNHQVRITGTVQSSSASATGAANAAPGSTAAGATLRVEKVDMVAAKCDPATK
jgi:hypothetical protein